VISQGGNDGCERFSSLQGDEYSQGDFAGKETSQERARRILGKRCQRGGKVNSRADLARKEERFKRIGGRGKSRHKGKGYHFFQKLSCSGFEGKKRRKLFMEFPKRGKGARGTGTKIRDTSENEMIRESTSGGAPARRRTQGGKKDTFIMRLERGGGKEVGVREKLTKR